MSSAHAYPSCFNTTNTVKKVYVTTPIENSRHQCCECPAAAPADNTSTPWQALGDSASCYTLNTLFSLLGLLFLCVCTRRSLDKSRCSLPGWQRAFCGQDVKGKIRLVLEVLDAKEREVRAAKDRLKCAEQHVRAMKLSSNQVHAAILCQMVKLREAQDWMDRNADSYDTGDTPSPSMLSCHSDPNATLDTLAQIGLLESQIRRLTMENNEPHSSVVRCRSCSD